MSRPLVIGRTRARREVIVPSNLRQYHLHVLGQFGLGKSTLLEHMIRTDVFNQQGLCLIDPHGSLYDDLLCWLTETGLINTRRVVLLEPSSPLWTFAFNPLNFSGYSAGERATAVDAMVKACGAVWGGEDFDKTPRLARSLYAIFHALSEKGLTLYEAMDLCLPSSPLRHYLTTGLSNTAVQAEWDDLNAIPPREYRELFESTRNRLHRFILDPTVAAIVSQTEQLLDLFRIMEDGGILLVNLARIGEEQKKLLGSLLVSNFVHTAIQRRKPNVSRPFYLYIDECYDYLNGDVARAITQCRKFGLHLVLSHQNIGQLREKASPAVSSAVMQIPNRIVFGGLPVDEAEELARYLFLETFDTNAIKHILDKPTVVRYMQTFLRQGSRTTGSSSTTGTGSNTSDSVGRFYSEDGEAVGSYSASSGAGESAQDIDTQSESETSGWSEGFVPILEERPTQTVSLEEQLHHATVLTRGLLARQAIVKLFGKPPVQVLTPFVRQAIAREERIEEAKLTTFERSGFASPRVAVQRIIEARRERLLAEASEAVESPESYLE